MNQLFIFLILLFLWACQSKEESPTKKQYLENCEALMSTKIDFIRNNFPITNKFHKCIKDTNYANHFYNAAQYYDTLHELCLSEGISFPSLKSKEHFVSNFLGISHSQPSPQENLLRKLKIVNFTYQLVTEINKKNKSRYYDHYTAPNQDFEGMVILNKTHFKIGDTLELYAFFYADKLKYQPNLLETYINDEKTSTYETVVSCAENKPCHQKTHLQICKYEKKDTLINWYNNYTIYPKP